MEMVLMMGYIMGGLIGIMLSFYLTLCFICWAGDVVETKSWRYWK